MKNILNYEEHYISESFHKQEVEYTFEKNTSFAYPGEYNYEVGFKSKSNSDYVCDLILVKESNNQFKNDNVFNLSFTFKPNHDLTDYSKYDQLTNKNEFTDLLNRIMYIMESVLPKINIDYPDTVILLGETSDIRKINYYRTAIKQTLPEYREIKDKSDFTDGLIGYFYKK